MPACSQKPLTRLWGRLSPLGFTCLHTKGRVCLGPSSSQGTALVPLRGNLGSVRALSVACTPSINSAANLFPSDCTDPPALGPVRAQVPVPRCWVDWKGPFLFKQNGEGAQQLPATHQDPQSPSGLSISCLGASACFRWCMAVFYLTKKWIMQVLLQAYPFLSLVGRKIPSLPKHSKPDSPDVGRVQSVESLKPVSVTSCLYGFTSDIAPGLNDAKELKSL